MTSLSAEDLEHDTVILIYELFYILYQTFHEMVDSSNAVGLLLPHIRRSIRSIGRRISCRYIKTRNFEAIPIRLASHFGL